MHWKITVSVFFRAEEPRVAEISIEYSPENTRQKKKKKKSGSAVGIVCYVAKGAAISEPAAVAEKCQESQSVFCVSFISGDM